MLYASIKKHTFNNGLICFSIELEEREEQGFLAGLKIPCPWATGKSIESIHPVRDNYKYKETVHIPGARCLFLRFDPRCSSQYDYDKVNNNLHQFQDAKLLAFWLSWTPKNTVGKPFFWQGFPTGNTVKIKALEIQKLRKTFRVFSEGPKELRKASF